MLTTENRKCFSDLQELDKTPIREVINKSKKIVVFTHQNPDGDALGSALGLYQVLISMGKEATLVVSDHAPDFLKWLPGYHHIVVYDEQKDQAQMEVQHADLLVFIDLSEADRLGSCEELLKVSTAPSILLDHHPQQHPFANFNLIQTTRGSSAEIVYSFLDFFGLSQYLDQAGATCFLTGIITDTLGFKVSSSYPEVFAVTMKLMEKGANKDQIFNEIYHQFSIDRMRLLGFTLSSRMKIYKEQGAACIYLSKSDMDGFNYQKGDSEGFVNYPLSIAGINCSVLFTEQSDHIKLSLRSTGALAVNEIAKKHFYGGGHRNAAGGKFFGSMEAAISSYEAVIKTMNHA